MSRKGKPAISSKLLCATYPYRDGGKTQCGEPAVVLARFKGRTPSVPMCKACFDEREQANMLDSWTVYF
jgi:hypothetical protein